jgi:hypothetical protein
VDIQLGGSGNQRRIGDYLCCRSPGKQQRWFER